VGAVQGIQGLKKRPGKKKHRIGARTHMPLPGHHRIRAKISAHNPSFPLPPLSLPVPPFNNFVQTKTHKINKAKSKGEKKRVKRKNKLAKERRGGRILQMVFSLSENKNHLQIRSLQHDTTGRTKGQ